MHCGDSAMFNRILALLLLFALQFLSLIHSSISIIPPRRPFNLSHFIPPKVTTFIDSAIPPQPPSFLQGILEAIANKEKWVLEDIRVAGLGLKKAKYRPVERYLFRVRVGKTEMVLKMYEEVSEWKKMATISENGTSSFEDLARKVGSKVVIDSFKIEGPLELWAAGDDDRLSLTLPLNTSYSSLRRISIGQGITVEMKGAEEISLFHPSDHHPFPFTVFTNRKSNKIKSIWPAVCEAPLPVHILGSATVVAHRTRRPMSPIHAAFSSDDVVHLLPEKCYVWPIHKKPSHPYKSLRSRITLMEKAWRNFQKEMGKPDASLGSLKTRIQVSHIFHYQLQVERDIRRNDTRWGTLAEWRTRPTIEHSWFDVLAKIEDGILKPLNVKRVRPFIVTDSQTWSSLLSNISFTKFSSILVPSEELTLDIKW